MKGKTVLVLAISFAFILGTMLVGVDGVFAAKDDETKNENKEKKEKKVIILYKSDKSDKKDEKGKKHKDKEKHVEKLKGKNVKIKYVYDIIPGIAATVDEDSIIDLMNDEDVLAVFEDVEVHTTLQTSVPLINADDVHATGITGKNVKVCIVDTGVNDIHPALNDLIAEYDFVNNDPIANDDNRHGTHVAGIVASIDSTNKGVAPGASLMAAKVIGSSGTGSSFDVVMGIDWCVANGADIISMSLSTRPFTGTCDSTVMAIASNNAVAAGVVVIASSGNDGDTNGMGSPSCASDVISVGAVSDSDVRASFSNGGRELDVVAPGVSITSLNHATNGFRTLSGTSMSAPHVSGLAALLLESYKLESNQKLAPDAIRKILRTSSVDLGSTGFDYLYGYGRINANDALAANANLFVSAENSWGDNHISGPQVIEVIVIDSNISDTSVGKGEPDVTVNTKNLRMVQAVDGNWYGYFADRKMASIADSTVTTPGSGLDFGTLCSRHSTITGDVTGAVITFTDTVGVAFPDTSIGGEAGVNPPVQITTVCTPANGAGDASLENNVVREAKAPNAGGGTVSAGQIGTDAELWPFIQLFDLNPTGSVVINYNKGGGTQSTTLTFDTVEHLAGIELDKSTYHRTTHVRATISDLWLNIDPTDEDSWTFGTNPIGGLSTNYQVFDENGFAVGDTPTNTDSNLLTAALPDLMCTSNCVLIIDPNTQNAPNPPLTLFDNADSEILGTNPNDPLSFRTSGGNLDGKMPVTLTELTPNSGVFGTYDEQDNSILKTTDNAIAKTSATINYNDIELLFSVTDISIVQINDGGNENLAESDASEDGTMWVFYENQPCCSTEHENAIYFQKSLAGEVNPEILIVDNTNVVFPNFAGIHAFDDSVHVTWIENTGAQPSIDDDLWIRTSTDGGDTFGPAVKILDGTYDHGNNGVATEGRIGQIMKQSETDGDLFMFIYNRSIPYTGHEVYKSTDNGATWTFQSLIPGFDGDTGVERTKFPVLSHNGIRVVGDTIHVTVGASDAFFSEYKIYYNRSDDDGLTWITDNDTQIKRISDYDISIDEDEAELHINGDKLIAIWMVYDPAEKFQYNTSLDGGDTWGTPQSMDICGNWYGQPQVDWASAQHGDNVAFVCAGNSPSMAFSDDFGTTWDVNSVPSSTARVVHSDVSENGDIAFTWADNSKNSVELFYAQAPISNGFSDFTSIEILSSDQIRCANLKESPEINFVPNSGMFVTYCTPDHFTIYFAYAPLSNVPTEEFFKLSKNSDSSDVREFETSDTMNILVFSPIVDTDNMKKAEYKIQDSKKVKLQGKLTLNADGVYSASVSLADLNAGTAKVELKLEDNNRNKFNVKENIIISGEAGSEPPTEEFFFISKNSDFSTDDREYTTSDTVFMKVFTDKEFATIKKTEYKIKMEDKTEVKGVLDDNGDGTFTASTDLLAFIGHEGIPKEFKLKVEGTDSGGGKLKVEFKPKITITS